jgi:hypothetical protein
MVRRYAETVEVRPADASDRLEVAPPSSFLWRGRLYVVREVLGHWRERRAWWSTAAARAVHGEITPDPPPEASERCSVLGEEHEVWRVEASRGRAFGVGVYDLCLDPGPASAAAAGSWRLVCVAD